MLKVKVEGLNQQATDQKYNKGVTFGNLKFSALTIRQQILKVTKE